MRFVLLVCVILATQGLLLAQEAEAPSRAMPAPKLGHPLDPADVAVLTGKAGPLALLATSTAFNPYAYWGYGTPVVVSLPYSFAPVTTATEPPFAPVRFGRFGDRPFVVIGRSTPLLLHSPLFFSAGTGGGGGVVLFGR